jgi:hypothetical protein
MAGLGAARLGLAGQGPAWNGGVTSVARRRPAPLTPLKRDATCQLLAAIIDAGLEPYGLTSQQEAVIVRALAKLSRTS